jgi:hypothetical protein
MAAEARPDMCLLSEKSHLENFLPQNLAHESGVAFGSQARELQTATQSL